MSACAVASGNDELSRRSAELISPTHLTASDSLLTQKGILLVCPQAVQPSQIHKRLIQDRSIYSAISSHTIKDDRSLC
ncbi:hypothetical protein Q8A67_021087 [Cirrhinus molitorella]|uniref:Uncharacterized protein n=1 Tax=Cirrhinus molitorella TaxID=172907 RepID=A0AA88PEP1_9TELE|nr:hypothetical protein Q8A67_021087 [Cirrhinus molitorella]